MHTFEKSNCHISDIKLFSNLRGLLFDACDSGDEEILNYVLHANNKIKTHNIGFGNQINELVFLKAIERAYENKHFDVATRIIKEFPQFVKCLITGYKREMTAEISKLERIRYGFCKGVDWTKFIIPDYVKEFPEQVLQSAFDYKRVDILNYLSDETIKNLVESKPSLLADVNDERIVTRLAKAGVKLNFIFVQDAIVRDNEYLVSLLLTTFPEMVVGSLEYCIKYGNIKYTKYIIENFNPKVTQYFVDLAETKEIKDYITSKINATLTPAGYTIYDNEKDRNEVEDQTIDNSIKSFHKIVEVLEQQKKSKQLHYSLVDKYDITHSKEMQQYILDNPDKKIHIVHIDGNNAREADIRAILNTLRVSDEEYDEFQANLRKICEYHAKSDHTIYGSNFRHRFEDMEIFFSFSDKIYEK